MTLLIKSDAPSEYTYGYIVETGMPGGPVVQVTRHMVGYGPANWVLHFTENANRRELAVHVETHPRGVPLTSFAEVFASIAANQPTTLPDLLQRLNQMGIDDMTGRMPYIDPHDDGAP